MQAENLTQYIEKFGSKLSGKLESRYKPLVERGHQSPYRVSMDLKREPFDAQWTIIEATSAEWSSGQISAILSGETGSGKTLVAMTAVHLHACGKPYRALIYCPSHLVEKWKREIEGTIPGAVATIIDGYEHLISLHVKNKPTGSEFFILSDSKAKLGTSWKPAYHSRKTIDRFDDEGFIGEAIYCPDCSKPITKTLDGPGGEVEVSVEYADLKKSRSKCPHCKGALYQWDDTFDRWPCSDYIAKRMRHWFQYFVLDESHQTKSADSASGNSVAQLASCIKYKLAMTGTILNGYADSLFPTLFRLDPCRMIKLGLKWSGGGVKFVSRYGRLETVTVCKNDGTSNKISRGRQVRKQTKIKPGIMPSLYGDCMMGSTTFLQLADLNVELPSQSTNLVGVPMDGEMYDAYRNMEDQMRAELASMLRSGSKAAMSILLQTLLRWPDHPYGFGEVGYVKPDGDWKTVCEPPDLDDRVVRAKERAAVDAVCDAVDRGNQCWLYTVMTQRHDVQPRLESLLKKRGLNVKILRSKEVPTTKREAWIHKNCDADCMIMHPQLVATGLDAFDSIDNKFNYNCLMFFSTGYVLDIVRQASGRAKRIGQTKPCELSFMYYTHSMQEQAAHLMAQKTKAAESLEGVFTESGLASLAGADDNAAMALVKALVRGGA